MARETEIKLRIAERKSFEKALRQLRARPLQGRASLRVRETNIVFDTPGRELSGKGQLLRIRTECAANSARGKRSAAPTRVLLTFKAPVESPGGAAVRHKVREETELELSSADSFSKILEALGLRPFFRYEKIRSTYVLPAAARWARGLLIELDETPIGDFVELEGSPAAIDRAAKLLGFTPAQHILANYGQLYREDCQRRGVTPGNMVFARRR
jgi:adenylate cyclase class 2